MCRYTEAEIEKEKLTYLLARILSASWLNPDINAFVPFWPCHSCLSFVPSSFETGMNVGSLSRSCVRRALSANFSLAKNSGELGFSTEQIDAAKSGKTNVSRDFEKCGFRVHPDLERISPEPLSEDQ